MWYLTLEPESKPQLRLYLEVQDFGAEYKTVALIVWFEPFNAFGSIGPFLLVNPTYHSEWIFPLEIPHIIGEL